MSIATHIERIQTARDGIRSKFVNLGLVESTANIEDLATAASSIENKGAVQATVQEGDTYTIPKGYHNGSGTVSGVSGGGNYTLQSKTITPTKSQINVTPDNGFYGLSDVTVSPIPENYQDVSSVSAIASDVLLNKIIVDKTGKSVAGTMPNNGAVSKTLTTSEQSFTIPKGYHDGTGGVNIVLETKSTTPTKSKQIISPSSGKVLSGVTVEAIPENFIDTTDADAVAEEILINKYAYVNGIKVAGKMPNNGSISATIDGLTATSCIIPLGYTAGGTISLTGDIEEALAAI